MRVALSPATSAALRGAKPAAPLFPNVVMAEAFATAHRHGPLVVLPRTDGRYALVDERRPVGHRTVSLHTAEGAAHAALVRLSVGGVNPSPPRAPAAAEASWR